MLVLIVLNCHIICVLPMLYPYLYYPLPVLPLPVLPLHDASLDLQLACISLAPACPDCPCMVLCKAGLSKLNNTLSTFTCSRGTHRQHALVAAFRLHKYCNAGIHGSFTEQYLGPASGAKPQSYNISKAVAHDGVPVYA